MQKAVFEEKPTEYSFPVHESGDGKTISLPLQYVSPLFKAPADLESDFAMSLV